MYEIHIFIISVLKLSVRCPRYNEIGKTTAGGHPHLETISRLHKQESSICDRYIQKVRLKATLSIIKCITALDSKLFIFQANTGGFQ